MEKGGISVFLNGEKTIDGYAKSWSAAAKGPVGFQHHGTPLWFKNNAIKPLED